MGNMSDCIFRGREFDLGTVPYFCVDFLGSFSSSDSRRVDVSYKQKFVHKVLVNHLVKLAQEIV